MFGATSIVESNDKEKYVYSGYGIPSNGKGEWSFDNDYARNVVIFDVDHSSSSHADNLKNNFSVLGEGDAFSTNISFSAPEKKFSINSSKANRNFEFTL